MIRRIDDGIIVETVDGIDRWFFSTARITRVLQEQGLSPDGAASIVGIMVERGMRALPRCPKCDSRYTGTQCLNVRCRVGARHG